MHGRTVSWPAYWLAGRANLRPDRRLLAGSLVQVEEDLPEQMKVRLAKPERLLASGVDPYPVGFPRTDSISELRARYPSLEPDTATGERVGVAGRVMLSRNGGKLCFATIRDGTRDIQVMISPGRGGGRRAGGLEAGRGSRGPRRGIWPGHRLAPGRTLGARRQIRYHREVAWSAAGKAPRP